MVRMYFDQAALGALGLGNVTGTIVHPMVDKTVEWAYVYNSLDILI